MTAITQSDQPLSPGGTVYLVGAGPGDPGLITVRGAALLAIADVVVYDALANPELLNHCRAAAEKIYVGKRAAAHSMSQEQINALLVQHGSACRRVVRLKGGDPFIFGRGGEECEALAAAGVAFEVVPGITAAIAAPAYAGIPVTHRDFNSSFTFITGHEKEEELREAEAQQRTPGAASDRDWSALAKLPCLAFYMGVKSLPRITANLIEHGMDPAIPAAAIHRGSTPQQRTVTATLGTLAAVVDEHRITAPAIILVGRVVSLRPTMNWFERRPLFGQTVVVTRTRDQASELSQQLRELGANVIEQPTITLTPPADPTLVDAALRRLDTTGDVDWVVFTSATGVGLTKRRLFELHLDSRAFGRVKIAAVGTATAAAVREQLGLRVELCPEVFLAESLADTLRGAGEIAGRRFMLLRADIGRPVLLERLRDGGAAEVLDVAVYENTPVRDVEPTLATALRNRTVDCITFTSSSTVRNFLALLGPADREQLHAIRLISIGPATSQTLREAGLNPIEAERHDIAGVVTTLKTAATNLVPSPSGRGLG